MSLLVDTGIFAAILDETAVSFQVSAAQKAALANDETTYVSPISFYEIGQKTRFGKWPEMIPYASNLTSIAQMANIRVSRLNGPILNRAALFGWDHRDPFDRIIVATAQYLDADLVTTDAAISLFYDRIIR